MSGGQIPGQMTIYDFPEALPEPVVGERVKKHGAVICHIMRRGYIGHKVIFCNPTDRNGDLYMCGILVDYVQTYHGEMRSIIDVGGGRRFAVTHVPGVEIYEPMPWDWYDRRKK